MNYVRSGQVSFGKRSYKLIILAVEKVWRLAKSGCGFVDRLATTVIGGTNNGNLRREL